MGIRINSVLACHSREMLLPNLSALSITGCYAEPDEYDLAWERWIAACTAGSGYHSRPEFKRWKSVKGKEKHEFYELINRSENDRFSAGQYEGPYTGDDIDVIMETKKWSIEHVLPRSRVNGRAPGEAEEDWLGWDVADRDANSDRSNLPLVLWPTNGLPTGRVRVGGVAHYNPPEQYKARLARKWLFLRATYFEVDYLDPPSAAQKERATDIIQHVRRTPIGYAERRFQALLEQHVSKRFKTTWKNPLYGTSPDLFLDDGDWRALVFM